MRLLDGKKVLIVCHCPMRGNSIGLIGDLLSQFASLKKEGVLVDLLDTDFFQKHKAENYNVNRYYNVRVKKYFKLLLKVPKLRTRYIFHRILADLTTIVESVKYDLIILYCVPSYSYRAVKIVHNSGAKVALFPWGSEVLRAKGKNAIQVKIAYSEADFIIGTENSNLIINAKTEFNVPETKIREQKTYHEGAKTIMDVSGKLSRREMSEKIGIPYSDYNIICGYSGSETQMHIQMIDAIKKNRNSLPEKYQLVFPVTYAADRTYIERLHNICDESELSSVFLTSYLTDEQIAYLHLISDLFINIQPTDSGNAFMIEELFCGNHIITGRWLHYDQFEQYGIPYYLIDSPDDLSNALKNVFTGEMESIVVPEKLKKLYAIPEGFDRGDFWREILLSV